LQTAIVMCNYVAFKGAPNCNCNVYVSCSEKGPQQIVMCKYPALKGSPTATLMYLSTLLSKGSQTAIAMCKYSTLLSKGR